jgi:hypothetical protein
MAFFLHSLSWNLFCCFVFWYLSVCFHNVVRITLAMVVKGALIIKNDMAAAGDIAAVYHKDLPLLVVPECLAAASLLADCCYHTVVRKTLAMAVNVALIIKNGNGSSGSCSGKCLRYGQKLRYPCTRVLRAAYSSHWSKLSAPVKPNLFLVLRIPHT